MDGQTVNDVNADPVIGSSHFQGLSVFLTTNYENCLQREISVGCYLVERLLFPTTIQADKEFGIESN